jgi:hypothetical protein
MPVGQSTATQQVETVTKDMTLDITVDDFAQQRQDLIRQLAAQYGVDPSLITLELMPGSVQIRVTIATTTGANATANITALQQTVAAVNDAALAAVISATMNTTVVVTSQPPMRGTISIEVTFSCPRGKWCTAGQVVDCPLGSYNELEDQDFATACLLCPPDSSTLQVRPHTQRYADSHSDTRANRVLPHALSMRLVPQAASTQLGDCLCNVGFYDANDRRDGVNCSRCVAGTVCATAGTSLSSLNIQRGYWRASPASTDVRRCPDAGENCVSAGCDDSSSGCHGGVESSSYCAPTLEGPLCRLCKNATDGVYYSPADGSREAACKPCGSLVGTATSLGVAYVAGAAFALLVLLLLVRKCLKYVLRKLDGLNSHAARYRAAAKPETKLKIIVGFCAHSALHCSRMAPS